MEFAEWAKEKNVKAIVKKFQTAGVAKAVAHYDGSGDSGVVESVEYFDAADAEVTKFDGLDELTAEIDTLACDYLENEEIDWYNGDGGYGDFIIDLSPGVAPNIKLEHEERIQETNSFYREEELSLADDDEATPALAPAPAPVVAECTCKSLIHGHSNGCPYITSKRAP